MNNLNVILIAQNFVWVKKKSFSLSKGHQCIFFVYAFIKGSWQAIHINLCSIKGSKVKTNMFYLRISTQISYTQIFYYVRWFEQETQQTLELTNCVNVMEKLLSVGRLWSFARQRWLTQSVELVGSKIPTFCCTAQEELEKNSMLLHWDWELERI